MYSCSAEVEQILRNQKDNIDVLSESNYKLEKQVGELSHQLSFTGLTTEELQGIHELIQNQIKFIADLQTGNDTHEIVSAVSSLVDLASLVSKPTEK